MAGSNGSAGDEWELNLHILGPETMAARSIIFGLADAMQQPEQQPNPQQTVTPILARRGRGRPRREPLPTQPGQASPATMSSALQDLHQLQHQIRQQVQQQIREQLQQLQPAQAQPAQAQPVQQPILPNPLPGIIIPDDLENLFEFGAHVCGPEDSAYATGLFGVHIKITSSFPFKAPTFTSPIFHPNVMEGGTICVDLLDDEWYPNTTIENVLKALQGLMREPNPDSPHC
ncbi:uncharacterized protein LOC127749478 [Frankliniella occidentalis]|uniref:Uncharacterized protein LOC127749478 n=1 Tax=Frankliniella occidentalis TaxID=133901 RepID=A0A9C6U028_FRAOC|nr:uncharacterized protein LOC127749478 [Frankliniella occidentalis]